MDTKNTKLNQINIKMMGSKPEEHVPPASELLTQAHLGTPRHHLKYMSVTPPYIISYNIIHMRLHGFHAKILNIVKYKASRHSCQYHPYFLIKLFFRGTCCLSNWLNKVFVFETVCRRGDAGLRPRRHPSVVALRRRASPVSSDKRRRSAWSAMGHNAPTPPRHPGGWASAELQTAAFGGALPVIHSWFMMIHRPWCICDHILWINILNSAWGLQ